MALIPMWKCDRDGTLFDDKKKAEEHDKFLELAANLSHFIETQVKGIPEDCIEDLGLLLAKEKELVVKAMKGKPDVLLEAKTEEVPENKVTAING